jgi:hypothetical protein
LAQEVELMSDFESEQNVLQVAKGQKPGNVMKKENSNE